VTISFPGDDFGGAQVIGLAIQSDGKIVAAISNFVQGFGPLFIVARLNVNGSLDPTFGSGGIVETQVGPSGGSFGAIASVLALQPDGKILLAGQNSEATGASGAIARYDANGQLDDTFGGGGIAVSFSLNPAQPDATLFALALQSNGDIVAAGSATNSTPFSPLAADFALARYTSNGGLDTTFGSGGKVTTAFGNNQASIYALALQSHGKIVAVGTSIARYLAQ
jgi:uncharacterized delta-60 repeat protein